MGSGLVLDKNVARPLRLVVVCVEVRNVFSRCEGERRLENVQFRSAPPYTGRLFVIAGGKRIRGSLISGAK